ncbi:hypothetical protein ACIPRL_08040 [Streptomyces sp. NPDC090085]|uniref:hypothetical protein n=1 Tax=Streptomyces sp. NPDC090085 TaxID=3365943 RepID=UPI0038026ED7
MPLRFAFDDPQAFRGRCDVSQAAVCPPGALYEPGAVAPAGGWRPIAQASAGALRWRPGDPYDALVEIVRPLPPAAGPLEALADGLGDPSAHYLGQALSAPGLPTTTDNYRDGRLIGLHLDNWDKLQYADKPRGRRRLALNLGPGDRFLIVGDATAQDVCRAAHADYSHRYPHTDDIRAWSAAGRPLTCYRIRLAPGEGYIAPTEYLPHDGSTEGQADGSAIAFWLGHWAPGALSSLV